MPFPGLDRSSRVVIVGAGAAGLAAAEALARAGYARTLVLEKDTRVGGKCSTFTFRGRAYELGAGALTTAYTNVRDLMRQHDVRASPGASGLFVDLDHGRATWVPPPVSLRSSLGLGLESVRFAAALAREPRLREPGFDGLSRDLAAPFATWAKERGALGIAKMIEPWLTGFGYGYLDETPAAYALKYALLFRLPVFELLDTGYQGLWERVARDLDVRLDAAVKRVERDRTSSAPIAIETTRGRFEADALILACDLRAALAFLDVDDEERALFSRVRDVDYHVVATRLERPPNARYGFFPKAFDRSRAGEPIFFYRRFLESELVLVYTMPPAGTPLAASEERVLRALDRIGWRPRDVERTHAWSYFPHVDGGAMREGYYERLEARQGLRRTFLAGELCAFTTVESVTAYSRALVARFFA